MQNIFIFIISIFIIGCTSDIEKAKKLGFSSVREMNMINEIGYKSYATFENDHPFITKDTAITKFAGAELEKPANIYGEKIDTVESPQMYKTNKDVYINTAWYNENTVKRILYICNNSKVAKVKLGSIDCSSTVTDLKAMNLKTLCDIYDEISPEIPVFYIKDRSFYSVDKKGKINFFGIASENYFHKDWAGGEVPSKLIYCTGVALLKEKTQNGGFRTIYEMAMAAEKGISNLTDWTAFQATEKFHAYKNDTTGILQKSLVLFASTSDDFHSLKDNGGLDLDDKWRGYIVNSVKVGHKKNKLTMFILTVHEDYKIKKMATLNNVKSDLSQECGVDWERIRLDVDDGYRAKGEFASCLIYPDMRGGIGIEVVSSYIQ